MPEEHGIYAKVCNVTSWERLKRDYEEYWSNPQLLNDDGVSYHLHDLIPDNETEVPTVIIGDFTPQVAEWVSGAFNRRIPVLGPQQFSVAGDIVKVRNYHDIDFQAIVMTLLEEFNPPWR